MSDAFYAWRGAVRKRQSTDTDVLDHPLVHEAFGVGFEIGWQAGFAESAQFAGAVATMRRCADRLEDLASTREAIDIVAQEEMPCV